MLNLFWKMMGWKRLEFGSNVLWLRGESRLTEAGKEHLDEIIESLNDPETEDMEITVDVT
jgi:hypothetical protein